MMIVMMIMMIVMVIGEYDDNDGEYVDDDVGVDGYMYHLYVLRRFTDHLCSGH